MIFSDSEKSIRRKKAALLWSERAVAAHNLVGAGAANLKDQRMPKVGNVHYPYTAAGKKAAAAARKKGKKKSRPKPKR